MLQKQLPGNLSQGLWASRLSELKLLEFDEQTVLLDPLTSQTHLLNSAAMRVLETLAEKPRSLSDLLTELVVTSDTSEGPPLTADYDALFTELIASRLIHAA